MLLGVAHCSPDFMITYFEWHEALLENKSVNESFKYLTDIKSILPYESLPILWAPFSATLHCHNKGNHKEMKN